MKKQLTLLSGLLAIVAMQSEVQAQTLRINGTSVNSAVVVDSFTWENGVLNLTTTGSSFSIEVGGTPQNPGPVDPDPGPGGPDPEPEPEPEPEPQPQPIGACENSAQVVCAYDINASMWATGAQHQALTIPKGKTLVSTFKTGSNPNYAGSFSFQVFDATPVTKYWISESPNGAQLPFCGGSRSFLYTVNWYQKNFSAYSCNLKPSTTYYFNLQHTSASDAASMVRRDLKVTGKPNL